MRRRAGFRFTNVQELTRGFVRKVQTSNVILPKNFVYRPEMLTKSMDQGICGSCWAFAIAGVMSDMVSIQTGGNLRIDLSPQQILECIPPFPGTVNGCDGNDVNRALRHMPSEGIVAASAYPYRQLTSLEVPNECPSFPEETYRVKLNKASTYVITSADKSKAGRKKSIESMKTHIFTKGPIVGAMLEVYSDFYSYDGNTIYDPRPGQKSMGGHAIEIIGWGTNAQGISYWICQQDWGEDWPEKQLSGMGKGWFYIRMGVNASRIEEVAYGIENVEVFPTPLVRMEPELVSDEDFVHPLWESPVKDTSWIAFFLSILITILILVVIIFKFYRGTRWTFLAFNF